MAKGGKADNAPNSWLQSRAIVGSLPFAKGTAAVSIDFVPPSFVSSSAASPSIRSILLAVIDGWSPGGTLWGLKDFDWQAEFEAENPTLRVRFCRVAGPVRRGRVSARFLERFHLPTDRPPVRQQERRVFHSPGTASLEPHHPIVIVPVGQLRDPRDVLPRPIVVESAYQPRGKRTDHPILTKIPPWIYRGISRILIWFTGIGIESFSTAVVIALPNHNPLTGLKIQTLKYRSTVAESPLSFLPLRSLHYHDLEAYKPPKTYSRRLSIRNSAIDPSMAGTIPVDYETFSTISRTTKSGKKLEYKLEVLQQPERARACGAGAKSSADRRPVDPPPVVELRILEDGRDVTFGYNANFFLFATLDASRTTAQPRGQPVTQPVLTGVPVAGMAYLDRPRQAGYFIFPDLSVRHEGHYRLTFNLFEETKEGKDDDVPGSVSYGNEQPLMPSLGGPQNCMHFRMIVRSVPFQVYSAKKFPGLSESTPLSRMVADQGCRVRIRRDVRMRRRGANGKEEYGDFVEDENVYARDRIATPDNYGPMPHVERPRSASRGSIDPSHGHGYPHDLSRRTSMTDIGHYHAGYHTPQTPAPPSVPGFTAAPQTQSHLSFGSQSAHQYQTPRLPPSLPPVIASAPPPNAHLYHSMHARQHSSSNSFPFSSPLQAASILQPRSDTPLITPQHEYKRVQYPFPDMSNCYGYADNGAGYKPSSPHLAPPHRSNTSQSTLELPPITLLQDQIDKRNIGNRSPYDLATFPSKDFAGTSSAAMDSMIQARKRTFDTVFPSHNLNRPLHSGMRLESPSHGHESPEIEGHHGHEYYERYDDSGMMTYRRADGVFINKPLPPSSPQSDVADPW